MIRCFQDSSSIQYYENNPAARDVLLKAIQGSSRLAALATPASTPRSEAVSTPLPIRSIAQESDNSPSSANQQTVHDRSSPNIQEQDEASLSDPSYRSISPARQGSGDGGPQYRTHCEDADDLQTGRTEESLLAEIGDSVDGQVAQSSGRPLRQAAQSAAASISHQLLGTATNRPRKRKHVSEGRDDTDGLQSTAPRPAEPDTESPDPEIGDPASLPILGGGPVPLPSATTATPQSAPGTVSSSQRSPSPGGITEMRISVPNSDGQYEDLDEALRTEAEAIAGRDTLIDAWHIFNYMAEQLCSPAVYFSTTLNFGVAVSSTSSSDARVQELTSCILQEEKESEQVKVMASLILLRKRVHLAELIGMYLEEVQSRKDEPRSIKRKMPGRPTVKDRFLDLIFPDTIDWKDRQPSKKESGQDEEDNPRDTARGKFKYWIQLGEPLARMSQRFGVGIVPRLPKTLTDTV